MAPSSSSHVTEIRHDVFISFRGTDVRCGLLSHLKKELRRRQIDVYVDDSLERGYEISTALTRAIETSKVLLVIFSRDYASSKWCLEELVKMIECMERNEQIVIPVFYNVAPADVRHQRGDYGAALAKHENIKEKWRSALTKAAQLSGFPYPSNDSKDESDLVDKIVVDVSKKLSKFYPTESNGLVGIAIAEDIAWLESSLTMDSSEVQILGIWGMGGIGKTTIARVVFDKISPQYEGCCFLEDVREELEKFRLSHLRDKLHAELLEEENFHINGRSKAGSSFSVKRMLGRKRVFVVLDDVNTLDQLKYLVGEPICFGSGSKVIVTTRDRKVLDSGRVHRVLEVKQLNYQESLQLFCLNAFNQSKPEMGYEELSKQAIVNAGGIPLALKVLGSHFHSKTTDTWKCELRKLKKYPKREIQRVLRFSYDVLDDVEKKVFLDIAFFFKGDDKDYVIRELDTWDLYGASGIEALQHKALITISNDNTIQMHDLIQEMAKEIVCQESSNPGRRSRLILRDKKEVYDVLMNSIGENDVVEAMLIDVSQLADVALSVETFKRMPNLRFLKFYCPWHIDLYMPPSHVLELLRGVQDLMNLQRTFSNPSKQLVGLPQFPNPSFVECANLNNRQSLHDLVNLMTIDVCRSKQLMELTDLSEPRTLEREYVLECESLCDGHPSILSLQTQVASVLSRCKEFRSIGSEIHIKSLDYLLIDGCSGPKEFSMSSKETRQLNLTDAGMEILNSSIGHLSNLEFSDMDGLQFKNLPNELFCLRSTYYFRLSKSRGQDKGKPKLHILFDGLRYSRRISCYELYNLLELTVPQNISVFSWFRELELDQNDMESLPSCIKHLSMMRFLYLNYCCRLRVLQELPPSLECLYAVDCHSLESLPANIKDLLRLEKLLLDGCSRLRSLPERPSSVVSIYAINCHSLKSMSANIKHFVRVEEQSVHDCWMLRSLPELQSLFVCIDAVNCLSHESLLASDKVLLWLDDLLSFFDLIALDNKNNDQTIPGSKLCIKLSLFCHDMFYVDCRHVAEGVTAPSIFDLDTPQLLAPFVATPNSSSRGRRLTK